MSSADNYTPSVIMINQSLFHLSESPWGNTTLSSDWSSLHPEHAVAEVSHALIILS